MTPEQARTLMALRGYTVQWHTPRQESFGLYKEDEEAGVVIFAEVNVDGSNVELSYVHAQARSLRVTTGQFSLTHPQFDIYESYVVKAAQALCLCGV